MSFKTDCIDFTICSEYIEKIFKDKSLESIDIDITKNCCPNSYFKDTINLVYPDDLCKYTASYCNFEGQNTCFPIDSPRNQQAENCTINPAGSYYFALTALNMYVNGELQNVLDGFYDLTAEDPTNDIQLFLDGIGFSNASVTLNSEVINDQLCVSLVFNNLPPGVVPHNFYLANSESCYVEVDFNCIEVTDTPCIQYSGSYDLFGDIQTDVCRTFVIENVTIEGLSLNTSLEFTCDDLLTSQEDLNTLLIDNGISTNVLLAIVDGILTLSSTSEVSIYINPEADTGPHFTIETTCTQYEEEIPKCIWKVTVPTIYQDYKLKYINTLFAYQNGGIAATPLTTVSYDINDDILLIESEINSNLTQGNFYITQNNDEFTFVFEGLEDGFIPDSIYFETEGGHKEFFNFCCDELTYFDDSYDVDKWKIDKNGCITVKGPHDDGIYNLKFTICTEDEIITEEYCLFLDCQTKCIIANITDFDKLSKAYELYETIKFAEQCSEDCLCEKMCELYKQLLTYLKTCEYATETCKKVIDKGCGCNDKEMFSGKQFI